MRINRQGTRCHELDDPLSDEHFRKGRYLLLRLSGHVMLRFTKTAGANCTLSGIFLDYLPPPAP